MLLLRLGENVEKVTEKCEKVDTYNLKRSISLESDINPNQRGVTIKFIFVA